MASTSYDGLDAGIIRIFGPPPPGLDLTESSIETQHVVVSVTYGLAVVFVLLRFWVRHAKTAVGVQADDWAVLVSLICTAPTVANTILAGNFGAGMHIWTSTIFNFRDLLKVVYAEAYLFSLAVSTTKASILLLYRRLFDDRTGQDICFAVMFWTSVALTASHMAVTWITMTCACQPVTAFWGRYVGEQGTCIRVQTFFLVVGIINMLNDVLILAIPIPKIGRLNLSRRKKISVTGIMLLGSFVCAAACVRIYYLVRLLMDIDISWWTGPGMAWSSIEPSVGIISACLPTLAPLLRLSSQALSRSGGSGSGLPPSVSGRDFSAPRSSQPRIESRAHHLAYGVDDDEIQLTSKEWAGDVYAVGDSASTATTDPVQGIRVDQTVRITSESKKGNQSPV